MNYEYITKKKYIYSSILVILIILTIGHILYKKDIDERSKIRTNFKILVVGTPAKGIKFNYEKMETTKFFNLLDNDMFGKDDYKYDLVCIFNSEYEEIRKEYNKSLLKKIKVPIAFIGFANMALPEMFDTYIGSNPDRNNEANIQVRIPKEGKFSGYCSYNEFNYEEQKKLLNTVSEHFSSTNIDL